MKRANRDWCDICRDEDKPDVKCVDCRKKFHRECLTYQGYTRKELSAGAKFQCRECLIDEAQGACFECGRRDEATSPLLFCEKCERRCHEKCLRGAVVPRVDADGGDEWLCPDCIGPARGAGGASAAPAAPGPSATGTSLGNVDICYVCQKRGKLLGCDSCDQSFHPKCLPAEAVEEAAASAESAAWKCPICQGKDPLKGMAHRRMTRQERTAVRTQCQRCVNQHLKKAALSRALFLYGSKDVLESFVDPGVFKKLRAKLPKEGAAGRSPAKAAPKAAAKAPALRGRRRASPPPPAAPAAPSARALRLRQRQRARAARACSSDSEGGATTTTSSSGSGSTGSGGSGSPARGLSSSAAQSWSSDESPGASSDSEAAPVRALATFKYAGNAAEDDSGSASSGRSGSARSGELRGARKRRRVGNAGGGADGAADDVGVGDHADGDGAGGGVGGEAEAKEGSWGRQKGSSPDSVREGRGVPGEDTQGAVSAVSERTGADGAESDSGGPLAGEPERAAGSSIAAESEAGEAASAVFADDATQKDAGASVLPESATGNVSADAPIENLSAQDVVTYRKEDLLREVEELCRNAHPPRAILKEGIHLKSYQRWGVNWLLEAFERRPGAILADEMGLGKTIQTLAFLSALKCRGVTGPHLVVVPLSTVGNWAREIRRFTPHLTYTKICGSRQERDYSFRDEVAVFGIYDIFITTYETCVTEEWFFTDRFHWQCVVLDEAHRIKSASARIRHSLDRVTATMRILLTGTPLQNNTRELFTLLNFLFPEINVPDPETVAPVAGAGVAPAGAAGESTAADDASGAGDVSAITALLSHLMLRRTKDLVVKLPSKLVRDVWLPLSPEASVWYRRLLDATNLDLLRSMAGATSIRKLLGAVIKMRVCCSHPRALVSRPAAINLLLETVQYNQALAPDELARCHADVAKLQKDRAGPSHILMSSKLVFLDKLLRKLHAENMARSPAYRENYEATCDRHFRRLVAEKKTELHKLLDLSAVEKALKSAKSKAKAKKSTKAAAGAANPREGAKGAENAKGAAGGRAAGSPIAAGSPLAPGSPRSVTSASQRLISAAIGSPAAGPGPAKGESHGSKEVPAASGRQAVKTGSPSPAGAARTAVPSAHSASPSQGGESRASAAEDGGGGDGGGDGGARAVKGEPGLAGETTATAAPAPPKVPRKRRPKDAKARAGADADPVNPFALEDEMIRAMDSLTPEQQERALRLRDELRCLETRGLDAYYAEFCSGGAGAGSPAADGGSPSGPSAESVAALEQPDDTVSFVRNIYPARLSEEEVEVCEKAYADAAAAAGGGAATGGGGATGGDSNAAPPPRFALPAGREKLLSCLPVRPHKVLIFTQFQLVLDELEAYCGYRHWSYMRLDGSTNKMIRELDTREFNSTASTHFVYLISTRAGGLGINLVTANHVVLYDEDWNPFVDLQAIDRAHRIGQVRDVTVWHLTSEWTVEERMVARRQHKLKLDKLLIQANVAADADAADADPDNPAQAAGAAAAAAEDDKLSAEDVRDLLHFGRDVIKFIASKGAQQGVETQTLEELMARKRSELRSLDLPAPPPEGAEDEEEEREEGGKGASLGDDFGGFGPPELKRAETSSVDLKEALKLENAGGVFPEEGSEKSEGGRDLSSAAPVDGGEFDYSGGAAAGDFAAASLIRGRPKRDRRRPRQLYTPEEVSQAVAAPIRLIHERKCFLCGMAGAVASGAAEEVEGGGAAGSGGSAAGAEDPLVPCMRCPKVYHQRGCLRLEKPPPRTWMCPWHECTFCCRRAAAAGGLLIHCVDCPTAFCCDCFPPDYRRVTPPPAFFENLNRRGWPVAPEKLVTFRCSKCKAVAEQDRRRRLTRQQLETEATGRKKRDLGARKEAKVEAQAYQAREREARAKLLGSRRAFLERKRAAEAQSAEDQRTLRDAVTRLYPPAFLQFLRARREELAAAKTLSGARAGLDSGGKTELEPGHPPPAPPPQAAGEPPSPPPSPADGVEAEPDARPLTRSAARDVRLPERLKEPGQSLRLCDNCGFPRHDAAACPFPAESVRLAVAAVKKNTPGASASGAAAPAASAPVPDAPGSPSAPAAADAAAHAPGASSDGKGGAAPDRGNAPPAPAEPAAPSSCAPASPEVTPYVLLDAGSVAASAAATAAVSAAAAATPQSLAPTSATPQPPAATLAPSEPDGSSAAAAPGTSKPAAAAGATTAAAAVAPSDARKGAVKFRHVCPVCHEAVPAHLRRHCDKLALKDQEEYAVRRAKFERLVELVGENNAAPSVERVIPTTLSEALAQQDAALLGAITDRMIDNARRHMNASVESILDECLEKAGLGECITLPPPKPAPAPAVAAAAPTAGATAAAERAGSPAAAIAPPVPAAHKRKNSADESRGKQLGEKRGGSDKRLRKNAAEGSLKRTTQSGVLEVNPRGVSGGRSCRAAANGASNGDPDGSASIQKTAQAIFQGNQVLLQSLRTISNHAAASAAAASAAAAAVPAYRQTTFEAFGAFGVAGKPETVAQAPRHASTAISGGGANGVPFCGGTAHPLVTEPGAIVDSLIPAELPVDLAPAMDSRWQDTEQELLRQQMELQRQLHHHHQLQQTQMQQYHRQQLHQQKLMEQQHDYLHQMPVQTKPFSENSLPQAHVDLPAAAPVGAASPGGPPRSSALTHTVTFNQ